MQDINISNLCFLDDIYATLDESGKILEISPSIFHLLGYRQDELIGTKLEKLCAHPQCFQSQINKKDKIFDDVMLDLTLWHKGGVEVLVSAHLHFLKDHEEHVRGYTLLIKVIGGERDVKDRLINSEKRYRTIFENSPSGIIYFDSNGIIIESNKPALKTFGVTKKQFIGFDLLKQLKDEHLKNAVKKSLKEGKAHYKGLYHTVIKKKTIYLEVFFNAILDEEGKITSVTASLEDQTIKTKALLNLEKSREEWKSIIDNMQDIFLQTDKEGKIIKVSPSIKNVTGYDVDEVLGKNIDAFYYDVTAAREQKEAYLQKLEPLKNIEIAIVHKNGSVRYFDTNITPRFDSNHEYAGSDNFAKDITELKCSQEKIEHMALHDSLTNLPNRAMLSSMLAHSIQASKRRKEKIAVLFLDLDNFKNINDSFGHIEGDRVLIIAAEQFKKILRLDDMVYRFGGDEFVIVLEHITQVQDIINVAQKINHIFDDPIRTDSHVHYLGCSIGIALYPDDALTTEDLIKNADAAVYKAKMGGKNTYEFYKKALGRKIEKEEHIKNLLRSAIEKKEFELYYQPQISVKTSKIVGLEALIRWSSPELGFTKPTDFIAIAEKMQLVIPLGRWVLETACKQVKKWHDMGIYSGNIGINISNVQITNDNLSALLHQVLQASGLETKYVNLEITESILMNYWKSNIGFLDKIKNLGVNVAIDDFGRGFSSLHYLRQNLVNQWKIDQSFIEGIPHDSNACAIVKTMIALAKNLHNKSIAVGVETEAQLNYLRENGCDIVQGYYYSEPLCVAEMEQYFKNNF
ncbi:EAL domain-containing protein [Sulfurospirillum sp. 1612]|uniref:EAL domain-containing protein n=1 Tax=Sulfurospirillum sp. 1612 TaxID=3094835 RepID=UPI002F922415